MEKNIYDFKNRTAVVTGGAQGFGLDIAKRFLQSYAWIIGALISSITYYFLAKK